MVLLLLWEIYFVGRNVLLFIRYVVEDIPFFCCAFFTLHFYPPPSIMIISSTVWKDVSFALKSHELCLSFAFSPSMCGMGK